MLHSSFSKMFLKQQEQNVKLVEDDKKKTKTKIQKWFNCHSYLDEGYKSQTCLYLFNLPWDLKNAISIYYDVFLLTTKIDSNHRVTNERSEDLKIRVTPPVFFYTTIVSTLVLPIWWTPC